MVRCFRLLVGAIFLPTIACGGGSGGDGGGAPAPAGDVEGTIVLPDETWSMLAEHEPNGTLAQAQVLPPIQPRSFVTVAGEAGVLGLRLSRVDTTDAYRIRCHVTQVVTLTLTASTDGIAVGNFDVAAFNTATTQSLGASATLSNPEIVAFTLPGETAADVVVTCASGDGAYSLRFATADPPPLPAFADSTALATRPAEPRSLLLFDAAVYLMDEPECAPGRLLVRPRGAVSGERLAARVGARVVRRTGGGSWVLELPRPSRGAAAQSALAAASRLLGDGDVEFAEPDWAVTPLGEPNDPDFQRQWNLSAIGCTSAWDITTGRPSVVVGVIDTGITPHPDLDAQRVAGFDFVSDSSLSGDGDGRDDDPTDPGGRENSDGTSQYHGTHVAGTRAQLRTTILSTCRDLDLAGIDDTTGAGLVQAGEAVRRALADLGTPRVDPPSLLLSSSAIRIPAGQTVGTVYVNNAGGGTLDLTSVVASTDDGIPWLTGFRTSAPMGGPTNTTLVVALR